MKSTDLKELKSLQAIEKVLLTKPRFLDTKCHRKAITDFSNC